MIDLKNDPELTKSYKAHLDDDHGFEIASVEFLAYSDNEAAEKAEKWAEEQIRKEYVKWNRFPILTVYRLSEIYITSIKGLKNDE